MTASRTGKAVLGFLFLSFVAGAAAQAQASRTWVSGVGDDANPCSRTAPCKTFAGAISKTAAGGEISVLDPGGFGAVTITKSITIDGDGTLAGILASGTNGIVVNAGATDQVLIRGISINGNGTGLNGIRYLAGGSLVVENVSIYGFRGNSTSRGIDVALSASSRLLVLNSSISNCEEGIRATASGGIAQVELDHVRITSTNSHAFEGFSNTVTTITHSDLSHNFNAGVRAVGSNTVINVEDTLFSFNNAAVNAGTSGAVVRLSNSAIVNNTIGITITSGATVESAGNNRVAGNGTTTAPNGTYTVQ